MATVTIDGVEVTVPAGTLLVEAAKAVAKDIPVYCYHTKLGPAGLCRICLVEIEGMPKLQIACNTAVTDGMKVHTQSQNADEGRRAVLEVLLLNHPLDCPICDKGGECDLQDFSMAYGQGASRLADPKMHKPKAVDLGPTIVLDEERCILCLRCVRFDDIITQEKSLRTEDRGARAIIATETGRPYRSDFSGNVTELCPVGALTSKTYRFKSRPWDLHRTKSTCLQCSVGCGINIDERHRTVLRTMSVPSDKVSDGWLCDRGRYNIGFYDDARRITTPLLHRGNERIQIGWDDAIEMWSSGIKKTLAEHGPGAVGVIGGGRLLNEEAWLLQHVFRAAGVPNVDWRAGRQRQATPGAFGGTFEELEEAQAIVSLGRPLERIAPIADLRIRKAVAHRGATLISIGDVPASSAVALAVREIRIPSFDRLADALPASAERIAFVWGGVRKRTGENLERALQSLASKTLRVYVPGEQPNARGAQVMGCTPREDGMDVRAMLEAARDGKLRALAIFGANPLRSYPDRALVDAALANLESLVVADLFPTETAERATLVLPACGPFEKTGTTTNMVGEQLTVEAGLEPPDGALSDLAMLVALADALGVTIPAPQAIERAARAALAAPARPGLVDASLFGEDDTASDPESLVFDGGGTAAFDERFAPLRSKHG
ncbi:MAG: molybdopterin-dependent oxidoreductase, partial [Candidatus Eremiobacteraeota bacterium]|nr:molybdopterin-dependent oxidoreductase [Candidatus Eremiobacteraeota bacterium]